MEKIVTIGSDESEVKLSNEGGRRIAGDVELLEIRGDEAVLRIGNETHVVPFVVEGERVEFKLDGEVYVASVSDKGARKKKRGGDHSMSAPMPGVVLKLMTSVGAEVTKGTPLLVLEAMKMEHQIIAPYDGTVEKLNCKEGEMVQPGVDLIELKPVDGA